MDPSCKIWKTPKSWIWQKKTKAPKARDLPTFTGTRGVFGRRTALFGPVRRRFGRLRDDRDFVVDL